MMKTYYRYDYDRIQERRFSGIPGFNWHSTRAKAIRSAISYRRWEIAERTRELKKLAKMLNKEKDGGKK